MKKGALVTMGAFSLSLCSMHAFAQVAGYFSSPDNSIPDIVLGCDGGDAGVLSTDPGNIHSDLHFYSSDEIWLFLDADDNSSAEFKVFAGDRSIVHQISEDGTKSAVIQTEHFGQRAVYSIESPEVWLEDFGSGSLSNGRADVAFEAIFAETVNRSVDYYVILTPVCDEPALLFVTSKTNSGFGVRGVTLDGRPSGCDFDYRITAKRLGLEEIRLEEVTDDDAPPRSGEP